MAKLVGTPWFDIGLSIFAVAFGVYALTIGQTATTVIGGTLVACFLGLLVLDVRWLWRGRSKPRPRAGNDF